MFRSALLVSALIVVGISSTLHAADPAPLQLPDTTPPGKPHFDSRGAKVGDQLPPLPMRTLGGKSISLGKAWSEGTTLLLTSSYTCPKSRATYPQAAELARRISGHGIRVAVVYVIEAHPAGDPSPYTGKEEVTTENRRDQILCRQPTTMDERLKLATEFSERFKIEIPLFVDEMNNAAWSTLGGGPNMGVLVDKEGIVLARQGWFDARSMESAVAAFIKATPKTTTYADLDDDARTTDEMLRNCIIEDRAGDLAAMLKQQPALEHRLLYSYEGESLIQLAAEGNHMNVLRLLVERGADVNDQKGPQAAPLQLAVQGKCVEAAKFLIEHGADVNAKDHGHGPTPLQDAFFAEKPELVAALIKAGAKPDFYTAAASGDLAELRRCFLQDATVLSRPDGRGRTALTYAAAMNRLDSAKLLISLGAHDYPADHYPDYAGPATHRALNNKNLDMLRLLLDGGCDPNVLALAVRYDVPVDVIRMVLDHKADPNAADERGLPPLQAAAGNDRREIMQLLLDRGADINAKTTGANGLGCGTDFSIGDTALHVAVKNRHPEAMDLLMKRGAKVNAHNADGATPLHEAARSVHNQPEVAERMTHALIENHADVNAIDASGKTPLDYAAPINDGGLFEPTKEGLARIRPLIEFLKKHGGVEGKARAKQGDAADNLDYTLNVLTDSDKVDALKVLLDQQPQLVHHVLTRYSGENLLQSAANRGRLNVVKLLVERGADVNRQDGTLAGPLHLAALWDRFEVVKFLVEHGADVNRQNDAIAEATPLHLAATCGRLRVAQFLIEHGADVNARAQGHGPTPLQEALLSKYPDVVAALTKAGARPNFYTAAATGDLATLRREGLADPTLLSLPDGSGRGPLMYAATARQIDSAKLLISLGAKDLPTDRSDNEAAWRAVENGDLEMTRILLDAGSDPNRPLYKAIGEKRSIDVVRLLLAHKANANGDGGLRPLHDAAIVDRPDIMQLLLDAGADINAASTLSNMMGCGPRYYKGDTPLHVAIENGHPSSAEYLIKHGANINARNEDGETPLHCTMYWESDAALKMTRLLIENHADVNIKDASGQTPLDYAERLRNGLFTNNDGSPVLARTIELLKKHGAVKGNASAPKSEK